MEISLIDYIHEECNKKKEGNVKPRCVKYTDIINHVINSAKAELQELKEAGFIGMRKGVNDFLVYINENEGQK